MASSLLPAVAGIHQSSPIIMVSNRLPVGVSRITPVGNFKENLRPGGFWSNLASLVWNRRGVWIGRSARFYGQPETTHRPFDQVIAVNLTERDFQAYNSDCCYRMLWPLFHSSPVGAKYEQKTWATYCRVNKEFARRTIEALREMIDTLDKEGRTDTIPLVWIHDYKLLHAATTIRQVVQEENLRCKLGYFLYVPFPSLDIMSICPWADKILQGILACDVVGFNNDDYCLNFLDSCQQLGCQVDRLNMSVQLAKRRVHVGCFPVGIDFNLFSDLAACVPALTKDSANVKVILAVDRLDYNKGIALRIRAFEQLLEKHPEHIGNVTLVQVAVPSRTKLREYLGIKEEVEQLINTVNVRYKRVDWDPIKYMYGFIPQKEIVSLYRDAAVAMVTPLKDGLSLVANEYVACQIREPGVLVLSPYASSRADMPEAIVVNPYNIEKTTDALQKALVMPLTEKRQRMAMLRQREFSKNVFQWMNSFLSRMEAFPCINYESPPKHKTEEPPYLKNFDSYLNESINDGCTLVVILEYEKLLTRSDCDPSLEVFSDHMRAVVKRLACLQDVDIALLSRCSLNQVRDEVNIEEITYAGDCGQEILHPDGTRFSHPVSNEPAVNLSDLQRQLQVQVCQRGAWSEISKDQRLTFYYREAPVRFKSGMVARATQILNEVGYQYRLEKDKIVVHPPLKWDHGKACIYILRTMHGKEWSKHVKTVYAGDDDAAHALKNVAFTFRVDPEHTDSPIRVANLAGEDAVYEMLMLLENKMRKKTTKMSKKFVWPYRFPYLQVLNQQFLEPTHFETSIEEAQEIF